MRSFAAAGVNWSSKHCFCVRAACLADGRRSQVERDPVPLGEPPYEIPVRRTDRKPPLLIGCGLIERALRRDGARAYTLTHSLTHTHLRWRLFLTNHTTSMTTPARVATRAIT
jgi:hypothetical protein